MSSPERTDAPARPRYHRRYVDSQNQGWHPTGADGDAVLYAADYGHPPPPGAATRYQRDLPPRGLDELAATRGPLRPVEPITDADRALLVSTFQKAGRKTITTLAAALEQLFHEIREAHGGLQADTSYDFARRTLTAGREGSWESALLHDIVLFGNELNLAKPTRALPAFNVTARRAAGPVQRVDPAAREVLVGVLRRWVTDPERYTELAETLAVVVSDYCDDTAGPSGWRIVADQWLQPGALAHDHYSRCHGLFYSVSAHFYTRD
jgi:hypothetical protein